MAKHDEHSGKDRPKPPVVTPRMTPRAQQMEAARREREAAALRENLARRKAQQRARQVQQPPAAGKGSDQAEE